MAAERSASQGARTMTTTAERGASQGARTTTTTRGSAPEEPLRRHYENNKRQRQVQQGEAGGPGGVAKRARRGGGESDARGGGQLDNRSHSRATGKRREVVRGVRIRRYGGQRIAMRRPLGYGAGRMKHNYKHVDRSGRRHVAWETTGGILLSSAEAAKQQGLRPTHVALGGGNPPDRVEGGRSSDGRRQAGRKFAGGEVRWTTPPHGRAAEAAAMRRCSAARRETGQGGVAMDARGGGQAEEGTPWQRAAGRGAVVQMGAARALDRGQALCWPAAAAVNAEGAKLEQVCGCSAHA